MSKLEWFLVKVKKSFSAIHSVQLQRGIWLLQRHFLNTEWSEKPQSHVAREWKSRAMPSNNHMTCFESKVAHQRICFHWSFKNNVKVKVMIHLVWLCRLCKTICSILSHLDICSKGADLFILSTITQYLLGFSKTDHEIRSKLTHSIQVSTQNCYGEEINNHSGLGSEKLEAF